MTDIRVSTVVMAHPRRRAFIPELTKSLGGTVPVVWDRINDRWDTGRRAILAGHRIDPKATHVMIIQDDAVVSKSLVKAIPGVIEHAANGAVLGLYIGKSRPFRQSINNLQSRMTKRTRWMVMSQLHWGVGVVIPVRYIPELVTWCDHRNDIPNYDKRMSRWFQANNVPVWYPWPSLVDHRKSPSLVPGRTSNGRHALSFIGENRSALHYDWQGDQLHVSPSVAGKANARPKMRSWRRTS